MASEYISQKGLSAIMWIGIFLSIIFVFLRTHVQYSNARKLFINDHFIFFALLTHIATGICYQIAIPPMYEITYFDPTSQTVDAAFMARGALFLKLQFTLDFLLWTTLWTVKFSLLLFFWRLFDSVRTPAKYFWWTMSAVTAATFVTLVVLQCLACDPLKNFFTIGKCNSARDVYYSNLVFKFTVGTDIAGDILIMFIPFPLLGKLQVPPRKKLILAAIFSLPVIPIIFAVLRLVMANPTVGNVDPVKFQLYSLLENSSAIVTSCLPSLRLFVVNSRAQNNYKYDRSYEPGQGDYFRGRVHGESGNEQGFRLETLVEAEQAGSYSRGRGRVIEEDAQTENSSDSQRVIIGSNARKVDGVVVTREFMVR